MNLVLHYQESIYRKIEKLLNSPLRNLDTFLDELEEYLDSFIHSGTDHDLFISSYIHGHFSVVAVRLIKAFETVDESLYDEKYRLVEMASQINEFFESTEFTESHQIERAQIESAQIESNQIESNITNSNRTESNLTATEKKNDINQSTSLEIAAVKSERLRTKKSASDFKQDIETLITDMDKCSFFALKFNMDLFTAVVHAIDNNELSEKDSRDVLIMLIGLCKLT